MTLLASWSALRFGELAELRRKELDLKNGVIHVRRAVVRADGQTIVGTPKSDAGTRDIAIPPHLIPLLKAHIQNHVAFGKDALLFPGAKPPCITTRPAESLNPSPLESHNAGDRSYRLGHGRARHLRL